MKNLLTYCLIFFYFLISTRASANLHYCGGKLKSITMIGYGTTKNCCKGKKMKKNCCKDYQYSFKKSYSEENSNSTTAIPLNSFEIVPQVSFQIVPISLNPVFRPANFNLFHPPPPPEAFPSIYLKNCVFII